MGLASLYPVLQADPAPAAAPTHNNLSLGDLDRDVLKEQLYGIFAAVSWLECCQQLFRAGSCTWGVKCTENPKNDEHVCSGCHRSLELSRFASHSATVRIAHDSSTLSTCEYKLHFWTVLVFGCRNKAFTMRQESRFEFSYQLCIDFPVSAPHHVTRCT